MIIFDFSSESNIDDWYVVDDGVMGGRSKGNFFISSEGHAVFEGTVSLENNGGFSSLRYNMKQTNIAEFNSLKLKVKGDGKKYQVRTKTNRGDYQSYITITETSGQWEVIEIKMSDMYPGFRGQKLRMPNYPGKMMSEFAILIGNKKAETFRLEIDKIWLE
jgi:hypothetical protein